MNPDTDLGPRALALFYDGKDAPEIARILTAEQPHGSPTITPIQARDLYQSEFRNQRIER